MPTTSHKKGHGHYKKKKYSYASLRAHVTDVMKFEPEKGAKDALTAIHNHAKALVKEFTADTTDENLTAGEREGAKEDLALWTCIRDDVYNTLEAIEYGPPPDEDAGEDEDDDEE